jgi:two-component system, chemotaxis family, protein-glutamate methylesterase/glutaminase
MANRIDVPSIIVIGASTGGLAALRTIVSGLPVDLPTAVCVVQHIDGHSSHLASLLNAAGPLPAADAKDKELIQPGRIYVAPPDHHLIVVGRRLRLSRGPRENFARPAVDPLFRSAAEVFGTNTIGVILTGNLSDGAAGLYEIKRRGGIAVVQDPDEAEAPGMPRSALTYIDVDHCVGVAAMPRLLSELANRHVQSHSFDPPAEDAEIVRVSLPPKRPIALTCPECGGATHLSELGPLLKFDCHIGHNATSEAMAAGQFEALEKGLEAALRRMNERTELCRLMRERALSAHQIPKAEKWQQALDETQQRSTTIAALLDAEWVRPEG